MPPIQTPEARRHAIAANAVGDTLRERGEWLRLSVREAVARAVLAAIDADQPIAPVQCSCSCPACLQGRCENDAPAPAPKPVTQDSTGWTWLCHHPLCPHGQEGFWTRRGATRARDRHLATHGADHA